MTTIENRDKKREASRRWYAKNRDKKREASRRWYAKNRDKQREASRRWYAKNRDKKREASRLWRLETYYCQKCGKHPTTATAGVCRACRITTCRVCRKSFDPRSSGRTNHVACRTRTSKSGWGLV